MPAKNHNHSKKCGHAHKTSHLLTNSPSINSISGIVAANVSEKPAKKVQEPEFLTKCPHVCLIGNFYLDELDTQSLLNYKQSKKQKARNKQAELENGTELEETDNKSELTLSPQSPNKSVENDIENESGIDNEKSNSEDETILHCEQCDQSKNLWLCLREGCMYIGCGGTSKDENSYKHSTLHAQNAFHPLAMNLVTKAIWCEFCHKKIDLQKNNPPFYLDKSDKSKSNLYQENPNNKSNRDRFDDLELIGYLDQECNRQNRLDKIFNLNNKKNIPKRQNSNYFTNNDPNEEESEDEDSSENNDKLNDYFMNSDNDVRVGHRNGQQKNGQVGLDNLGNTCYMSSALQSLSNCTALTSYFIECSEYIHMRILHKSNYFDAYSIQNSKTSNSTILPCLSLSYMKLMSELWEDKKLNKNNKKKNHFYNQNRSYTPNEFVQVVKYLNPMFRGYMQHDSQEFLIYLMDQLHEELKRPVFEDLSVKLIESSEEEEENQGSTGDENDSENENRTNHRDGADYQSLTNQQQIKSSDSSNEVDSGIHRLSIKSFTSSQSSNSQNSISNSGGDDESADSFETCTGGSHSTTTTSTTTDNLKQKRGLSHSDLSDSNFSDAYDLKTHKKKTKQRAKKKNKEKSSHKPAYSSILSEIFEGKLIGQVQCLECRHLSTTTESFQHLSLPIPTKEYLQSLQNKVGQRNQYQDGTIADGRDMSQNNQGWISWMSDFVKGYIWTQTIKLQECLTAFFSDDDLRGDNMYSCEKCKKLTNGVKYSKLLELPETLIIHLKRFRHDSMFSTGKISSYVSFPLDDLEMSQFLHTDDRKNENSYNKKQRETQYELSSIICHYGGANGGHYIAYARNYLDEEWYEYDDSYCKKVDILTVQNVQAYVLFYKKKSLKMDMIKDQLRAQIISKTSLTLENSLLQSNYISKQWLQKLKYFAEPGPVDNTDFLCKHNFVQPCFWHNIESLVVVCSTDTWLYLLKTFGLKHVKLENDNNNSNNESSSEMDDEEDYDSTFGVCNYLYPCRQCQIDDELMKQRQIFEKNEFLRLTEKSRFNQLFQNQNSNNPYKNYQAQQQGQNVHSPTGGGVKLFAISSVWFKQWEQFVQFKHCPQKHQIPGQISNLAICNQQMLKIKIFQLNKNSNHYKITEEVWIFLHRIYGGGPELLINGPNLGRQSLRTMSTSSTSSMKS